MKMYLYDIILAVNGENNQQIHLYSKLLFAAVVSYDLYHINVLKTMKLKFHVMCRVPFQLHSTSWVNSDCTLLSSTTDIESKYTVTQ